MTLVAGVDSSTQSCKIVVRDAETGALVRSGKASHPDGTEVHPDHWWSALQEAATAAGGLDDVAAISIITFDSLSYALLAPGFVVLCNVIEGQLVTPLVVGRRLEINSVAIFIAIAFWSWLWGFVGALMAVPLLVVIKVFCDHFEGLRAIGNFLAAESVHEAEEEAEQAETPKAA